MSLELPFPLVGDPEGTILKAYEVRWPILGTARRATFVIGPDRKVRIAFHNELDMESHVDTACRIVSGGTSAGG